MFENLEANAVTALLPEMSYALPYVGTVDIRLFVAAGSVFVGLTAIFWVIRMVVLHRARRLAEKTSGSFDDVIVDAIESIKGWVYSLVALYASLQFFTLPETVGLIMSGVFYFVVVWQGITIAGCFVQYFTQKFIEKDEDGDGQIDANAKTAAEMVTLLTKIVLWAMGILFVLSNLGFEVTSLLAGLGIGGIAVAFALQGILSDLFASFSLYFDKPFRIGDFVVIGADAGTVEKIGIKTTRIRTLQGEELVVSNAELTTARVQNFKRMNERRIASSFGIAYETDAALVKQVPETVQAIFDGIDGARLDRIHFATFGDSALIYEFVYFVESSDYAEFMSLQQKFNFDLMDRFAEAGIEFAYPTQTIYHKQLS